MELFPETCRILDSVLGFRGEICRMNIGYVYFSIIHKGTHILPHCGVSNVKLRIQLPLIVNGRASMKVKNVEREYHEGEVLVLDDSFVHEVIYRDEEAAVPFSDFDEDDDNVEEQERDLVKELESIRVVLLIDINHPDLSKEEVQIIEQLLNLV